MSKNSISKTAQANLQVLANLGVPEAKTMKRALDLPGDPLGLLSHLPFARRIPLCVSCIAEVLYQSANDLILLENNPTILDLGCGYSPRVLLMAPMGYTYIGADLPDVIDDLMAKRRDIVPAGEDWIAGYRTADATNQEQMESVLGGLREPITVVTQGLLSYLTLEQKQQLATNIRDLLKRDGGSWIIPDVDPGTLLPDTFEAILGAAGARVVNGVYGVVDKHVGRDRSKMGWQNSEQIAAALGEMGFSIRHTSLWREDLALRCFNRVGDKAAEKLKSCWKLKSSLVATL